MLLISNYCCFSFCFRTDEYPLPGSDEKKSSILDPVKNVWAIVWLNLLAFFANFKPSFFRKQWQILATKTWFEIIFGSIKIIFKCAFFSVSSIYYVNKFMLKIILELMLGKYGYVEEEEEPPEKSPTLSYTPMALMSSEDLLQSSNPSNITTDRIDQQLDEGIVEDLSKRFQNKNNFFD